MAETPGDGLLKDFIEQTGGDDLADFSLNGPGHGNLEHVVMPVASGIGTFSKNSFVLALGKLGGRELNFSSDIDLMLTYAEAGNTQSETPISNHEFFIKVGQHLVSLLETFTEEGFVFRIDLRLRPNGASGPLALSFDAMDHYYTTHGRDWERYALIKTRALNLPGGHSDLLLEKIQETGEDEENCVDFESICNENFRGYTTDLIYKDK